MPFSTGVKGMGDDVVSFPSLLVILFSLRKFGRNVMQFSSVSNFSFPTDAILDACRIHTHIRDPDLRLASQSDPTSSPQVRVRGNVRQKARKSSHSVMFAS